MKRETTKWAALTAMLILLLSGCGSNRGTDGTSSGTTGGDGAAPLSAETVGLDVCTNCHAGQTAQWLGGAHGNFESIDASHNHIDLGMENDGFPYYSYFSDSSCADCHDPLGDGERLIAEWTGNVARPVIGCESCHGGGQLHNGIGPLPYAKPGAEQCGQCHNADFDHNKYHPEADNIVEDYQASPHARSINDHNYADGSEDIRARCSKCHTDEGAKRHKGVTGGYDALTTALPNDAAPLAGAEVVSCRTCHDGHNPEELLFSANAVGSAEYNTCTSCHQLTNSDGTAMTDAYHDPAVNAYGALNEVITDTHIDDGTGTRGYNIDPTSDRACRDCHNVHAADTTINNQWAASGHGDLNAPFTTAHGAPTNPACQECHSATGATMLFEAYETGGTYTAPGSNISGPVPEVIYCTVCHSDNSGGLRAPGAITTHYNGAGSDTHAVIDAVNGSNLCLSCHAGKRSGEDIKDGNNPITARVTSHYMPVGGVLYGEIGYEFDHLEPTLNYDTSKHTRIGDPNDDLADWPYGALSTEQVTAIQGAGNGPCVSCHMAPGTDSHLYSAFTDNTELGLPELCYNCHSNDPASPYFKSKDKLLNETKVGYAAAISYIETMMADGAQNYTGGTLTIAPTGQFQLNGLNLDPAIDVDLAGALFNYKLFKDDHGGYVHNRYYAKQLLFDSIDYLEDGAINGSITVGDSTAAAWLDGDAATSGIQRK